MSAIKIENVQKVYLNGKKATIFSVYRLVGDSWVFNGKESISGHYSRESTILSKR